MLIREATGSDSEAIRHVYMSAFPEAERGSVTNLALELLTETTVPQTLTLLAELDEAVIGAAAYSPVTFSENKVLQGYILAPLGVLPAHQKSGIGSQLIEHGKERLSAIGTTLLFVYGDPDYYGKFGFSTDVAEPFLPPYKLQYPFGWQCVALDETDCAAKPQQISCVAPLSDPGLW